ncbi:efflux RND transporter permease subunit [Xanthovirga aplysinae]|uniref:efflux RND transporter permease subunit n=1 Tax=Xanthovirga aplysinae TaxID=2529853 RepID=UPI0012BC9626|nr:efflux RND transporter permease subunit [Xanthovirga aplysinae]MTI32455.1 efflux RND transporter permease subunit [Xanthovirga aplysinae]
MRRLFKGLIEQFVRYPILANIIIAFTLLAGIASFLNTKKSFFPLTTPRNITIQVAYPGASPEEMEEGVTLKIEEAIYNIAGIEEINSTSSENFASINILTLKGYDIEEVYTEIKNAVDGISSFPVSAERPLIYKQKPTSTTQWVTVTGDVDLKVLKRYAEEVEDDLLASGVISQIATMGYNPLEISIEVSEENLSRFGITFDQVAQAVRANNRDISAGSIKAKNEEILIRSRAKQTDAEKIGEIILRANPDGSKLFLREVATIKEQFNDAPNKWKQNGKIATFLRIDKLEDEDLQEISQHVRQYADEFNKSHEGVELIVAFDFMDYLQQRLSMLTTNGLVGISLVLICLGVFLSLRLSLWVAWGIPSSFLGLFIFGAFFGLTINMISLFGMILVIGILVDDGIVIAENIYAHFERHGNPYKAAIDGTIEVLPAVTTSVSTTMIAFSPLLFIDSMEFLRDMAIVVIVSLGFSLIEAFFVLPSHLGNPSVLRKKKKGTRSHAIREKVNRFIDFLRYRLYGKALTFTLKNRAISVAILISLFPIIGGLLQGGIIKSTFFPNIPFSSFNIDISFKPGTREDKVEKYLDRFDKAIWEVNNELKTKYKDTVDYINFSISAVGFNMSGSESGSHAGGINIFHKELDDTPIPDNFELIRLIREKIGDVPEAEKFSIGGANQFGKPVSVKLIGKNIEELNGAKELLKSELSNIAALKEIQDNVPLGKREMLLDLKPDAYFLGLNHNDITKQVRQGFFGEEVQRLQKGTDEVRVWVRYPNSGRLNTSQMEKMKIKTPDGRELPLNELTEYSVERGVSGIRHFNTARAITVEADVVDPNAEVPPILEKVNKEIIPKVLDRFPTVKIDYGGQSRQSQKAMEELMTYFGGAFIAIFFVLLLNFRSFYQSVLIMTMIPLGFIGGVIGHGIEGIQVSLLSAWGLIALSGVIINDAVVFLDKYNLNLKKGMKVMDAAFHAGIARFRPIMLTSITTIAGLYPIIKETSFQAQFLIPMAVSVAYGVLIGTFIILLFFPVVIVSFNDVRKWAKWLWEGEKPTPEEVERVIIDQKRDSKIDEIIA